MRIEYKILDIKYEDIKSRNIHETILDQCDLVGFDGWILVSMPPDTELKIVENLIAKFNIKALTERKLTLKLMFYRPLK